MKIWQAAANIKMIDLSLHSILSAKKLVLYCYSSTYEYRISKQGMKTMNQGHITYAKLIRIIILAVVFYR